MRGGIAARRARPGGKGLCIAVSPVLVAACLLASCQESSVVRCSGDRLCPSGTACDEAHGGCVLPGQLEACQGEDQGAECSYRGEPEGACYDGVCLPAGCGNGIVDDGELCDDGNLAHGDGCSADCASDETCGNGEVDVSLGESCDDGNTLDGDDCQSNCVTPACGDGVRDTDYLEACDEGENNSDAADAACRTNCQKQRCGDGIVDAALGEGCDDGNFLPGDGCSEQCAEEVCGNGVLDVVQEGDGLVPAEGCDDGEDGLNHDGCATLCRNESPLWDEPAFALPPFRREHAMVYVPGRMKVLLHDGRRDGRTWEYSGQTQTWNEVAVQSPGPPRTRHAMAYDAARDKVILFGGTDYDSLYDDETWEYDPGSESWTRVAENSPATPAPRIWHAMAYDAARERVILFGGRDDSGADTGETWEYDGASQTWTRVAEQSPTAPAPRVAHAMTYDPTRGRIVLFGGNVGGGSNQTWEYDGATETWTQVAEESVSAPTPRWGHAVAYDAARKKVVLFGGWNGAEASDETWDYDAASETWTRVAEESVAAPSERRLHALAYDLARGRVVLFGGMGDSGPESDETWEYDGATEDWNQVVEQTSAPSPRFNHAMAYDADRAVSVLFGGTDNAVDDETWEYDAQSRAWSLVTEASATAPSPRARHAMAYDAGRGKVVLFGGLDSSSDGETWEYDGANRSWDQVAEASPTAPSPRTAHAMAYDASRGVVVLFGGNDGTDDDETWEYDAASETWTRVAEDSAATPSPRRGHAMAYDPLSETVVLFGGLNSDSGYQGETWEYDGATETWTRVAQQSLAVPAPRWRHTMVYDASRQAVLLFAGDSGGMNGETWEYDVASETWSQIVAQGSSLAPAPRAGHAASYDAVLQQVVLFGGHDGVNAIGDSWHFRHSAGVAETCTTGHDADGDGLVGCADPDCWGRCTPRCPPHTTPGWPGDCDTAAPRCGDDACNPSLETPRLCPADCGAPPAICGDFLCDASEAMASCPGDCTP